MRRIQVLGLVAWGLAVAGIGEASACHTCGRTPCVVAPPPYQCVTEMVPYTVMRPMTKYDFIPVTKTIMVNEPETTFVPRQRVVCRPEFKTTFVPVQRTVCKPVFDTHMETRTVAGCRPVTTTRLVTTTCMQPQTRYVTVPAGGGCKLGLLCGKNHGAPCGGCVTVPQTCYVPVPVTREVVETHMVPDVRTIQVPVTTCRMVTDVVTDQMPITHCRMVQEVITEQVPIFRTRCVPKTITTHIPVPRCEMVPVTLYKPVTRMVPCAPPVAPMAPASYPTPLPATQGPIAAPTGQG